MFGRAGNLLKLKDVRRNHVGFGLADYAARQPERLRRGQHSMSNWPGRQWGKDYLLDEHGKFDREIHAVRCRSANEGRVGDYARGSRA